mgnify:CR=1 FL=1
MSSIVKFNCSACSFSNSFELTSSISSSIILVSSLNSSSVNRESIYAFLILSFLLFNFFSSLLNSSFGLSILDFKTGRKNSLTTLSYSKISASNILTASYIFASLIVILQTLH